MILPSIPEDIEAIRLWRDGKNQIFSNFLYLVFKEFLCQRTDDLLHRKYNFGPIRQASIYTFRKYKVFSHFANLRLRVVQKI